MQSRLLALGSNEELARTSLSPDSEDAITRKLQTYPKIAWIDGSCQSLKIRYLARPIRHA